MLVAPPIANITPRLSVQVDLYGWPRWTRFNYDNQGGPCLNEEEVRALHYHLGRIVSFLDRAEQVDDSQKVGLSNIGKVVQR